VTAVALSPDGKVLASGGLDKTIRFWRISSGKQTHQIQGHSEAICALAFSPDGKRLASGSADKTIRLWDPLTGKELRQFHGHHDQVSCLEFSRCGRLIVSGSWDKSVRLWDISNGRQICKFTGHVTGVSAVVFSSEAESILSGGLDHTIRHWDAKSGQLLSHFGDHQGIITSLALSPDGKVLVSGGATSSVLGNLYGGGTLRFWELATAKELKEREPRLGMVMSVKFSPDGKIVATGGLDGQIHLWSAATGKEIHHFACHHSAVAALCFSPDGKTIASGGWDNVVRLSDVRSGETELVFPGHEARISSISFSKDGRHLVTGGWDRSVRLWNLSNNKEIWHAEPFHRDVSSVFFQPSGTKIVCSSPFCQLDAATGEKLPPFLMTSGCLALSSDGRTLASAIGRDKIGIWKLGSYSATLVWTIPLEDLKESGEIDRYYAFSPNNQLLAVAVGNEQRVFRDKKPEIRIFDLELRKERGRMLGHDDPVTCLVYSPDGKTLASGSCDGTIRLWEVATGKERDRLLGHHDWVGCLAYSADGTTVASGSCDRTIRLWEVATRKERGRFVGHLGTVNAVAFCGNGRILASGSDDTTALVWDLTGLIRWQEHSLGGRRKELETWDSLLMQSTERKPSKVGEHRKELEELWSQLAGDDALKAYKAIWKMVAVPEESVAFLDKQLHPVVGPNAELVAQMIERLDSDDFQRRQEATLGLARLGELTLPALKRALERSQSLEARRRIKDLLEKLDVPALPDQVRGLRAVEVLAKTGSSGARAVLIRLSKGAEESRITQAAMAALKLLERRNEQERQSEGKGVRTLSR
jgi:WD40 repeat protein